MSEVIFDVNTYVNKKVVSLANQTDNSALYPNGFPSYAKSYIMILPIVGTLTSTGSYDGVVNAAYPEIKYSISTQTYCHFRDI